MLAISTTTNDDHEENLDDDHEENLDDHHANHLHDDQEHNNNNIPRFRDIHALTPPHNRRQFWDHRTPSLSFGSSEYSIETNVYSTMSREFNALVFTGSTVGNNGSEVDRNSIFMGRIGEDEEVNPLAIVPDNVISPVVDVPQRSPPWRRSGGVGGYVTVEGVKKGEVEMKISAWQNGKVAKITNRFKCEEAIINGWEAEQVHKSTSKMKKVERKLEEKRARAKEKMENEIAKAHRKAEERKASAESRRGTKVAKVFEIAHLMKAVGKPPPKRSFL